MAENSAIEWTDHTFNPWRGCVEVHAGCDHCYARELSKRNPAALGTWGADGVRVLGAESYWKAPEKWNRDAEKFGVRARVFCASLADVFEDWQGPMIDSHGDPVVDRDQSSIRIHHVRQMLFSLIDATPWLDWILVTKRPENIRRMWDYPAGSPMPGFAGGHRRNVWLLTSVSDQASADRQIPDLLKCRDVASVLGISAEPLLGPLSFRWAAWHALVDSNHLDGLRMLDWVIVGGESGPHARPMHPDWSRTIRDECLEAGVPFFFKQWGEFAPSPDGGCPGDLADSAGYYFDDPPHKTWRFGKKRAGRRLDGREWNEYPAVAKGVIA